MSGARVFPVSVRLATRDPHPLADAPDEEISSPLWTWSPDAAREVVHERRRRFGIEEERIDVTTLSDDEDEEIPA